MKYIPAGKLIAEIERLKSVLTDPLCSQGNILGPDWVAGENKMLNEISSTIDSLQQEQPDNEDIDKVAQEFYEYFYELKRRDNISINFYDKQEIIDILKAGIEYGRNHPKQEQPEVELEKVHDAYCKVCGHYHHTTPVYICRHACDYFNDFKALLKNARKEK